MLLTARQYPRSPQRCAFTIVEMLIVVLVMGILAAAAVPKFVSSLRFHAVQSAARRIKADLEHLRETARLTSRTQTIAFAGMTYGAEPGSDFRGVEVLNNPYSVDLAAAPYELDSVTVDFNDDTIISFDPYGMPLAPGEIRLEADPHACRVTINPLGLVEIAPIGGGS